jgi:hypothetical protein
MSKTQDAFVLGATVGRSILRSPAYYDGEGEWVNHDNAQVYYSRKAMREGLREAKKVLPEGADAVHAFGVIVS